MICLGLGDYVEDKNLPVQRTFVRLLAYGIHL
jgi:hypothetical protein